MVVISKAVPKGEDSNLDDLAKLTTIASESSSSNIVEDRSKRVKNVLNTQPLSKRLPP
jgi:hypothetical protein